MVKTYLLATRYNHICLAPQYEYVLKGFAKSKRKGRGGHAFQSHQQKKKKNARGLKAVWTLEQDQDSACRLWVAEWLCFFGVLCSGAVIVPPDSAFNERYHLSFKDISIDSHSMPLALYVMTEFRKGDLCLMAEVLDYMHRRGVLAGPLFWFSKGRYLTRPHFMVVLQRHK